jgi:hypothetical protein
MTESRVCVVAIKIANIVKYYLKCHKDAAQSNHARLTGCVNNYVNLNSGEAA